MSIIAYLRVSTDEQAESGLGMEAQIAAIEAKRKPDSTFRDDGCSGADPKREGLLAALDALKKGDTLIVAKRDRLGRDPILMAWIEKEVIRRGATLKSAAGEGTDGNSPTDILLRRIIDSFSEYERLVIGSRTSAALQAKKRKGEFTGGGVPIGYRISDDGKRLVPVEEELAMIAFAQKRHQAGDSFRAIAGKLFKKKMTDRLLHPQTVKRIIGKVECASVTRALLSRHERAVTEARG